MRFFVMSVGLVFLSSSLSYAAGSGAHLPNDLATLKSKVAQLKTDLFANQTTAIAADKTAVHAARDAVIEDLNSAQTLLAPARSQIMSARQANELAQQKYKQDKASGNNTQIASDLTSVITAFQNLSAAQDAYIALAASNGLPVPTAQQLAMRQSADAVKVDNLQLRADTMAQNSAAISVDQAKLATDQASLANAQVALLNAQASSASDPSIAEAEHFLGTYVAPSGFGGAMGHQGEGGNSSAFGSMRR